MKVKLRRDYNGKKAGEVIEVTQEQFEWLNLRKRIEPLDVKVESVKRETKIDPEIKKRKKKDFIGQKNFK